MGRANRGYDRGKRDGGSFATIPHVVLDSVAYQTLSTKGKALLVDFARQVTGRNNGSLACTWDKMKARGWKSEMTLLRAKEELVAHNLIAETRKGGFPHSASLYGVTWLALEESARLDITAASFPRGSYQQYKAPEKPPSKFHIRERKTLPIKTEAKPYQNCSYETHIATGSPIKTEAIRPKKAGLALSELGCSIESTRQYPGLGGAPVCGGGVMYPERVTLRQASPAGRKAMRRWGLVSTDGKVWTPPASPSCKSVREPGTEQNRQPETPDAHPVELTYEPDGEPVPDFDESQDVA